ncbi:MAG: hypothetical protein U0670_18570 [Anaerolineae bacterium]
MNNLNQRTRFASLLVVCALCVLTMAAPVKGQTDWIEPAYKDDHGSVLLDDGTVRVLYQVDENANEQFLVNLWGFRNGQVVEMIDGTTDMNPFVTGAWSPDCASFAFGARRGPDEVHRVYRIDPISGKISLVSIPLFGLFVDGGPTWSPMPGGEHLIAYVYADKSDSTPRLDIVDTEAETSRSYVIDTRQADNARIEWWDTANQLLIRVMSLQGWRRVTHRFLIDVSQADPKPQLLSTRILAPLFYDNVAPLTLRMLYREVNNSTIWFDNPVTGKIAVTDALWQNTWSWDGTQFVYRNIDDDLIVVDAETSAQVNVTEELEMQPIWSSLEWSLDSRRIYWWSIHGSDRESYTQYQSVSANGSDYRIHWQAHLPNFTPEMIPFACILPQDND